MNLNFKFMPPKIKQIILIFFSFFYGEKLFCEKSNIVVEKGFNVSLITCKSSESINNMFGHSALRIHNKDKRIDYVYNFGAYDSSETNFLVKVLLGKQKYKLVKQRFSSFLSYYRIKKIDSGLNRLSFLY